MYLSGSAAASSIYIARLNPRVSLNPRESLGGDAPLVFPIPLLEKETLWKAKSRNL